MRSFLRALLLAVAIGSLTPGVALCQLPDDDFDEVIDDAPPPPKAVKRAPRESWRNSPLVWAVAATALAVAIPLGIYKTVGEMRRWAEQQDRKKAPWEREPNNPPK